MDRSKFEELLYELRAYVLGQTIASAATVAEEIDSLAARGLFGLSSDARSYPREFSVGPPKSPTTHVNQMILSTGALSFFLHAIDRLSYRPNSEALREAIYDPIAVTLSETFAEMLNKRKVNTTGDETLDALQGLNISYAEAPTLAGTSAQDKSSALWLAARAIAEDAGYPKEVFVTLLTTKLMDGLIAIDLANRIKALEAVH